MGEIRLQLIIFALIAELVLASALSAEDSGDLAKKLANPVANLISVPLQFKIGRMRAGQCQSIFQFPNSCRSLARS